MNLPWILFLFICVSALVLVVADAAFGLRSDQAASIIAMLALLAFIGSGTIRRYAGQSGQALKHIAIWLGIVVLIAAVAVYVPEVMG
jgi:predicted aspartyl protease